MAVVLVQTDTAATGSCVGNALCSGNSNNTDTESNQAEQGGTAGTTERTVTVDISAADLNCVWMQCNMPAGYDGSTGDWTARINISASNHQISLDEAHICRVNSSCANQETLGSTTGIASNLGSTGTRSITVNQGTASTFAAGDKAVVVFAFDNAQAMTQDFGYTPSVNTDAPGSAGSSGRIMSSLVGAGGLAGPGGIAGRGGGLAG